MTQKNLSLFILSLTFLFQGMAQENSCLLETIRKHNGSVSNVAFSHDGQFIASTADDRTVFITELANTANAVRLADMTRNTRVVAFHPQGDYLLVGNGNIIKLFSLKGEYLNKFMGHATDVWSISFDPSGKTFVSGSFDKTFRLWDFEAKTCIRNFEGHTKSVLAVCFSHDGKRIASGSLDQTIRIWDAATGQCLQILKGHGENIYSVDFSPDDHFLVSGSRDNMAMLWDLENGTWLRTLKGHEGAVFAARFLKDGIHMLTASMDGTVRLWDGLTGETIYIFIGHKGSVNDLEINPDGSIFATASFDKTLRIWKLEKKLFVDYYFPGLIDKELIASGLEDARKPDESAAEYKARLEKANELKNKLYGDFFVKYQEMISGKTLK
jgi:hypothetical protein